MFHGSTTPTKATVWKLVKRKNYPALTVSLLRGYLKHPELLCAAVNMINKTK